MRKREKAMEKQNRVNEEKESNTQRQEAEEVPGREKVDQGAISKMGKQREITTKPKPVKLRKRRTKKND